MKRIFAVVMSLALIMSIAACGKKAEETEVSTTVTHTTQETANSTQAADEKEKISGNVYADDEKECLGGYIESDKYRLRYYAIPYQFVSIVSREEYLEWKNDVLTQSENDTNIMRMVRFIKDFNISKEVFEKTNLQMAKDFVEWGEKPTLRPMDYENQQTYEIYNADIIYTFDNEIINEYYLTPDYPYCADFEYEAAVERGEYKSQTEEWVDIDQMEAEINAKYGAQETAAVIETTAE